MQSYSKLCKVIQNYAEFCKFILNGRKHIQSYAELLFNYASICQIGEGMQNYANIGRVLKGYVDLYNC